jgi:hypothetical protein
MSRAIFSIIGVTYAVLLAFVAMLAWDGFNKAKAASHLEAVLVRSLARPVRPRAAGPPVGPHRHPGPRPSRFRSHARASRSLSR